jgi:hypothetical protein
VIHETGGQQTVTLVFDTVPGRGYILQGSGDLEAGWGNLSGLIIATEYQTVFTATVPDGDVRRFYRLLALEP